MIDNPKKTEMIAVTVSRCVIISWQILQLSSLCLGFDNLELKVKRLVIMAYFLKYPWMNELKYQFEGQSTIRHVVDFSHWHTVIKHYRNDLNLNHKQIGFQNIETTYMYIKDCQ